MPLKTPALNIESEKALSEKSSNGETRVSHLLPNDVPAQQSLTNLPAPSKKQRHESRGSTSDSTSRLKHRAAGTMRDFMAEYLRKIKDYEGIESMRQETKHFANNTTLHGPKRIYYGKKCSLGFWTIMMVTSLVFLVGQTATLLSMYSSHPIVSQVSFLIKDDGIEFPVITLCNFNPIKKSYIKKMNRTGDVSDEFLNYLLQFLIDTNTLYATADREKMLLGEKALQVYKAKHSNFTVDGFLMDAGFDCQESMMMCSFGGRQFDCCQYMSVIITSLGKCFKLDLRNSDKEWMKKQIEPGVTAGLQIILDAHLEEIFEVIADDIDPIFADDFENGFRYYIHSPNAISYLASDGIIVSPGTSVYSAISTTSYVLLPPEQWGNCTSKWPEGFHILSRQPYSAVKCVSKCKANFFNEKCGCSPFIYDTESLYPMCTPFQTIRCIDDHMKKTVNGGFLKLFALERTLVLEKAVKKKLNDGD
ncbi:hypothetical protein Y032_0011g1529 [Ancylostoma ceylanicum]|nr:hypothetical protein Y032_0011g1529 [Ancylostoma ceylanicum]